MAAAQDPELQKTFRASGVRRYKGLGVLGFLKLRKFRGSEVQGLGGCRVCVLRFKASLLRGLGFRGLGLRGLVLRFSWLGAGWGRANRSQNAGSGKAELAHSVLGSSGYFNATCSVYSVYLSPSHKSLAYLQHIYIISDSAFLYMCVCAYVCTCTIVSHFGFKGCRT